jgi:DNA-binding MarR family transcriptional regulator
MKRSSGAEGPAGEALPTLGEIGLDHFAPYLINRISSRYTNDMQEVLKSVEMTTAMMRALAVLSLSPTKTISELSALAITEQSTMSRTLDGLEAQGLVQRMSPPHDLRFREVSITSKGRAVFARVWPLMYEKYTAMFAGIDAAEYAAFVATLHKVLNNVRRHEF